MSFKTDVLIVGAGPTGLMFACQLQRFGINFRIIDKQIDRAQESRAFGIQAKSMEIFQNLGVSNEFTKRAQIGKKADFYFNGHFRFSFDFSDIEVKDTPFPAIYFLPQSDTEEILLDYLKAHEVMIERQVELISFLQNGQNITATIRNNLAKQEETIACRYIIGCDGAHSRVRNILGIPFVGASYLQKFILADVEVRGDFPVQDLTAFIGKEGNLISIPLKKDLNRLVILGMDNNTPDNEAPLLEDIETFINILIHKPIKLANPIWISPFHLHHRAVQNYHKGLAFLAGDAAHIHTPVGAQGMNTGLQDASNLAWKIAMVLRYQTPSTLLNTYQAERAPVGQTLVKTTDRIFGLITSRNPIITALRMHVLPIFMKFLLSSKQRKLYLFNFLSELGIHYPSNAFIVEKMEGADDKFLKTVPAGHRAPDAPVADSTLFEMFKTKPFNILLFNIVSDSSNQEEFSALKNICPDIISLHTFNHTPDLAIVFDRYGISHAGIYMIRPDGYVGFRSFGSSFEGLLEYLRLFILQSQKLI